MAQWGSEGEGEGQAPPGPEQGPGVSGTIDDHCTPMYICMFVLQIHPGAVILDNSNTQLNFVPSLARSAHAQAHGPT